MYNPVIRKFSKGKVHSPFMDNIWGAERSDMQLIGKFNKEFGFSLCVIYIYSKYTWVIPFKDKKWIIITDAFRKNLN